MRPAPKKPVADLEELRRLLISPEQGELRALKEKLADKEQRARDVSSVLPEAVKLSRERGSELTKALLPAVEGSVRESIEKRPRFLSMRSIRSSAQSCGGRSRRVCGISCSHSIRPSSTRFRGAA
jgi:hypothetical protein